MSIFCLYNWPKNLLPRLYIFVTAFALQVALAAPLFSEIAYAEPTKTETTVEKPKAGALKTESPLQKQVRAIAAKLRCPVCQGESVYDSHSDVAEEMKRLIADKIKAGESEAQILDYFHDRYGNYILMEPPAEGIHWVIWVFPLFMGLMGLLFLLQFINSNRQEAKAEALRRETDSDTANVSKTDIEELRL